MSRCPFATWTPVTPRSTQKRIRPAGLVCHTAVSNSSLLKPSGDVRWHFYNNREGRLYQFFDTEISAACQRDGNYWTESGVGYGFVSCESWDGAYTDVWPNPNNTDSIPPWTNAQMETWVKLGKWLHEEHGVPLVKATAVRGRGIGYHAQYTATDASGKLRWNESHACPAKARIAQMPEMIRRMNEEEDMALSAEDKRWISAEMYEQAKKVFLDKWIDMTSVAKRYGYTIDPKTGKALLAPYQLISDGSWQTRANREETKAVGAATLAAVDAVDAEVEATVRQVIAEETVDVQVTVKDETQ